LEKEEQSRDREEGRREERGREEEGRKEEKNDGREKERRRRKKSERKEEKRTYASFANTSCTTRSHASKDPMSPPSTVAFLSTPVSSSLTFTTLRVPFARQGLPTTGDRLRLRTLQRRHKIHQSMNVPPRTYQTHISNKSVDTADGSSHRTPNHTYALPPRVAYPRTQTQARIRFA